MGDIVGTPFLGLDILFCLLQHCIPPSLVMLVCNVSRATFLMNWLLMQYFHHLKVLCCSVISSVSHDLFHFLACCVFFLTCSGCSLLIILAQKALFCLFTSLCNFSLVLPNFRHILLWVFNILFSPSSIHTPCLFDASFNQVFGALRMAVEMFLMWNSRMTIDGSGDVATSLFEASNLIVLRVSH